METKKLTIDKTIEKLTQLKKTLGGDAEVCIKDADTDWHIDIDEIRESKSENGRVLISGFYPCFD